ncbi:hypothetical protein B0H16DRAFT_1717349 [Mycena metata]|uniref:Uncharacterized protein n=1 Tax=Mycena metata TaxID=1033252 RepID=A0AAD7JJG2_9AGAR|nr:hypothetical protein B0H16DRAFT_1717349 [Mycena metata]
MFNSKALLVGTLAALAAFASANPTNLGDDTIVRRVQPAPDATSLWAVYPGWDMANPAGISSATVAVPGSYCTTTLSPSSCWLKDELNFSAIETRGFPITLAILGACGTFNVRGPALCFTVAA